MKIPDVVAIYKSGKENALMSLVGKVIKDKWLCKSTGSNKIIKRINKINIKFL